MIGVRELLRKLRGSRPAPVIHTEYGPVTEAARAQCALNMLEDPVVKLRVENVLCRQYGEKRGMELARERYFEAYRD